KKDYRKRPLSDIAAHETANNAIIGGVLVPLLSLGIPGSPTTTVYLGAFIFIGVITGFDITHSSHDYFFSIVISMSLICCLFYSIVISMLLICLCMFIIGFFLM